ncbi:MAG: ribonucleotide reductase N-terminal alpha domain-containing protein, partial [Nitrospiraceae bacterium]
MPHSSQPSSRLSANALTVLRRRYLAKNAAGKPVETPARMFRRVAGNIAEAERRYPEGEANLPHVAEAFY